MVRSIGRPNIERPSIGRLKKRADFLRAAKQGRKAVFPGLILQAVPYRLAKSPQTVLVGSVSLAGSAAGKDAGQNAQQDAQQDARAACIRVGFTASRAVGAAVARNRARRRLRSLVREVMPDHAQDDYDYVVIARRATLRRPYADLRRDLMRGLKRLTTQSERPEF